MFFLVVNLTTSLKIIANLPDRDMTDARGFRRLWGMPGGLIRPDRPTIAPLATPRERRQRLATTHRLKARHDRIKSIKKD